ncbi:MAG TPA: GAF domain-containing protein, partial [Baekduia sp.]
MSSWNHDSLVHAARRIALMCALAVAVIGAATLAAWAAGITVITRPAPTSVAMKADTALALLLLGVALAAHAAVPSRRWVARGARAAGWAAAALVAATALQWIVGADFGIDQLLVADPAGGAHPGRSTPAACVGILLVAGALEIDRRRAIDGRLVNGVVGLPLLAGLVSLTGYLSGITSFAGLHGALRLSSTTAGALVLAGVAVLLARPQRSMVRLLVSPGPGGMIARRLLPFAVALPLVLDGLRLEAVHHGLLAERIGDWLFAFLILTIMAGLVLRLGRGLDLLDLGRRSAEERLRSSEALARSVTDSAHDAIVTADEHGAIMVFNPAAERLFGWGAGEVLGRPVTMLVPKRRHAAYRAQLAAATRCSPVAGGGATEEQSGLTKDGRVFDLELSLAQDGGQTTAIMRDITARKEDEQLARDETERMARVVAAHSTIAAGAGELHGTMDLIAQQAGEIVGADGAVVELPDGDAMVYRAVFGTATPHLGLRIPRSGSLAGAALDSGLTLHCADSATDPRVDAVACGRIGLRSMICVPLRHGSDVVGVLKVFSSRAHAFGERDERTLELVGGLAASTVHRAQVEQRLAALHAASDALAGARTLDGGLAGALRGIGEQLGWAVGSVWLADPGAGALACVQTWQWADLVVGPYLELGDTPEPYGGGGLLATVWDTGTAMWLERVDVDPERSADPRRMVAAASAGLRTLAAVPIVNRGETVGVLELGCRLERTHDTATLELIADIATQIGQFVQRRRAEERMAVQAANLAAVAELSQNLSHIEDPLATRPALCRAIRDLARADQVLLLEPDGAGRLIATAEDGGLLPPDITLDLTTGTALAIEVFHDGRGRFVPDYEAETTHARAL